MENLLADFAVVSGRIVTIIPLLLVCTLFMGKRSVGELPVFDYLIMITLASVTGADIADPTVPHIHTAYAIVAIAFFQRLWTYLTLHYKQFGKRVTFAPTIVMEHGKFIPKNIRHIHYTLDNIIGMLREKDVFHHDSIHYAIIEANGRLSILKNENGQPERLSYPLIVDGELDQSTTKKFHIDELQLITMLKKQNIRSLKDIFYADLDHYGRLTVTKQNGELTLHTFEH
ncbi:DUF421 domain-containing protein [Geomicrobium sp. JCM 19038]|uniref:YetF domain-containing protein n=1 Tax=Geomicrobium sp. JCM 19038 TaxID=1460635 RepID=UPI00045F47F3|nr:DUF421 domain-containing protein [Geomicrobium sp. JCM 19038]GAK06603.1 hypothetical protein JCM19038_306 [Geomicrobium sp. JCM 19038]